MSESLCQNGEVTVNSGTDHQLKLNIQTLLKHIIIILQMGEKARQALSPTIFANLSSSQELEERHIIHHINLFHSPRGRRRLTTKPRDDPSTR